MASTIPPRPGYLTLSGVALNYAFYGGAGYLAAGRLGAWAGAGLFTVVLVGAVVVAASVDSKEQSPGERSDA